MNNHNKQTDFAKGQSLYYKSFPQALKKAQRIVPTHSFLATAYSEFLRDMCRKTVRNLMSRDLLLHDHLKVVLLGGEAAYKTALPYISCIKGAKLPPHTVRLWHLIYLWLFVFSAKKAKLPKTRFLDADLSTSLHMFFSFEGINPPSAEDLTCQVEAEFLRLTGFSPTVHCQTGKVNENQAFDFMTHYCIFGEDYVDNILASAHQTYSDRNSYLKAVKQIATHLRKVLETEEQSNGIIQKYQLLRSDPATTVCVHWLAENARANNDWHKQNARFFGHIQSGKFDSIVAHDVTKKLDDKRNNEKENRFTIVKIDGLHTAGDFIPAINVVLKLRGLPYFRGDVNNLVDILKEYANYIYIHNHVRDPSPYFLGIGPLLLTVEKLALPLEQTQLRQAVGIFLEEIILPRQSRIISCRVKNLTDFWAPDRMLRQVRGSLQKAGAHVDEQQLRKILQALSFWLLKNGLSIDYCDIGMILDTQCRITKLVLFDLERMSFSELVNENHLVLDTLIDIKRHLRKDYWPDVLKRVYLSAENDHGFRELDQIYSYLRPRNMKRYLAINSIRKITSFLHKRIFAFFFDNQCK